MNKYIIYTIEGMTESPNGMETENCQVLGWSKGKNEDDAIRRLFIKLGWLEDQDFNPAMCEAQRLHDDVVIDD